MLVIAEKAFATQIISHQWSPEAGKRSAIIYSLPLSAEAQGVDPQTYLRDLIERVPTATTSDLDRLTPANWASHNVTTLHIEGRSARIKIDQVDICNEWSFQHSILKSIGKQVHTVTVDFSDLQNR